MTNSSLFDTSQSREQILDFDHDVISPNDKTHQDNDPPELNSNRLFSLTNSLKVVATHANGYSNSKGYGYDPVSDAPKKQGISLSTLSAAKKYTLLTLAIANFGAGCGFSLPAPFFPREAELKGATPTEVGLVFSVFELVMFLGAPLFGNYLTAIGPKFMFSTGILVAGTCSILFGFLDQGPSGTSFIVMSFLVRIFEGAAVIAFFTASQAVITHSFPDNVASVFALQETCIGIGMMIGPTIGGALYEAGGFGLPFWVVGAVIICCGIPVLLFLPNPEDTGERKGSVFSLLRSPRVCVTVMVILAGACGMAFLEPTLSIHLETFGLNALYVGLSFVIVPGLHAALSPFWGYLSDKKKIQMPLMIGGGIVSTLAFLLIGPSPLLWFIPSSLGCVYVGLALFGATLGCCIVPTISSILQGARELGFPDNIETFGLVSGLFNSAFCLGAFIGPTIGGILVDNYDFETSATVIAGIFLAVVGVSATFAGVMRRRERKSKEGVPLLGGRQYRG